MSDACAASAGHPGALSIGAIDSASPSTPSSPLSAANSRSSTDCSSASSSTDSPPPQHTRARSVCGARSQSTTLTEASRAPSTRTRRAATAIVAPPAAAAAHVAPGVVAALPYDVAALLPSSSASLATLLASELLPSFLRDALLRARGANRTQERTSKQRFVLAAAAAQQIAEETDATHLHHTKEALVAADSEAAIPLAHGIREDAVVRLCEAFGFPPAPLRTVASLERIDAACRVLLRALCSPVTGVEAANALETLLSPLRTLSSTQNGAPASAATAPAVATAATSAQTVTPLSLAVRRTILTPVSAARNMCWYRAVAFALACEEHELSAVLKSTLQSITDAAVLTSYGLLADPTCSAADVEAAKTAYLSHEHFRSRQWAGTLEMYLLSHAREGDLSFLVVDPTCSEPLRRYSSRDLGRPYCGARMEVALHHCSLKGKGRSAHYDLFQYELSDGSVVPAWSHKYEESSVQRSAREKSLLLLAASANARAIELTAAEDELHMQLAAEEAARMEEQESTPRAPAHRASSTRQSAAPAQPAAAAAAMSSPPRVSRPARVRRTLSLSSRADSHPPAAAAAPVRGQPASAARPCRQWTLTRQSVWREIPAGCAQNFLVTVMPMFEKYHEASASGDLTRCAQIMQLLLDLPSQALVKGRRDNLRTLKQNLQDNGQLFEQLNGLTASPQAPIPYHVDRMEVDEPAATALARPARIPLPSVTETVDEDESLDAPGVPAVDPLSRSIRRAVKIVQGGGPRALSRAARALMQGEVAPINSNTIDELRSLHPQAQVKLAPIPSNRAPDLVAVDEAKLHSLLMKRVNNGSAPGPSGWTGSHLMLVADCDSEDARKGLCSMTRDICNGVFGGQLKERLLASTLVPIAKPGGKGVRPIAMGEVFVKLAAHYSMALIESQMPKLFPHIQFGVKRSGGSESAAQLIRAAFDQSRRDHSDTILLKTDFANAFNSASRAQMWQTLLRHKGTEPIWKMFHWAYASATPLLVFERDALYTMLESSEGVRQGDPFAAFAFALLVQSLYERAIESLPDCKAVSVLDDLTLIGPVDQVMKAYDRVKELAGEYQLQLRVNKCQVFMPESAAHADERLRITRACAERQLAHSDRMELLGVAIGSADYVQQQCDSIVDLHEHFFTCLSHPSMPTQIGFALLRYCAVPRLGFLARVTEPEHFHAAAAKFDARVLQCCYDIMRIEEASRSHAAHGLTPELLASRITLPIARGGLGLRPFIRVSNAAYFSSLAATVPAFIELFPSLTHVERTSIHKQLHACREAVGHQGVPLQPTSRHKPTTKTSAAAAAASAATPPAAERNTIHLRIDQLWQYAAAHVKDRGAADPSFLHPRELQHQLVTQIEDDVYAKLVSASNKYHQTILTALKAPGCSSFLTVLPTLPCYRMSDTSMRLAVRHRLGLLPFPSLRDDSCSRCNKSPSFAADPDHLHSCVLLKRTVNLQRHNNITQVLMDLGRSVGFIAIREPNDHIRPSQQAAPSDKHYDDHADILFLRHERKLYVDVCVTRPTNTNNLRYKACRETLGSAMVASQRKHQHYDELARLNGYSMFAFAMESYGGITPEAVRLLRIFAKTSRQYSEHAFMQHAYNRLSVTLQSANATLSEQGMQAFLLDRVRQSGVGARSRAPGQQVACRAKIGTYAQRGPTADILQQQRLQQQLEQQLQHSPLASPASPAAAASPLDFDFQGRVGMAVANSA